MVYEKTDSEGNTLYTDYPDPGANKLDASSLTNANSIQPAIKQAQSNTQSVKNSSAKAKQTYTVFDLQTPAEQQHFHNEHSIAVTIKIDPALQSGDKIQLYLDGKAYGEALASTSFTLNEVDRGIHQLSASLFNPQGSLLKSTKTITIYVHYAHI
jgi:hypothetical protein